jgi:hypothetical protein
MSRNRQSGWIGLPYTVSQAKTDDTPRGVFVGPARAVHSFQGCRSVGDTDTVRRSPGLPLLPQGIVHAVLLVGSSKINQPLRCTDSNSVWLKVRHYVDRPLAGFRLSFGISRGGL